MLDALKDALIDTLKISPFLYLTYLCMEYLEAHTEDRIQNLVKRAGWMGPFWGSLLGAVPQCGFSAAASNLYAGRTITLGTLIAIFLSTSDEMLPIMLSESVPVTRILRILLVKVVIGIICGFLIDGFCHLRNSRKTGQQDDGEAFLIERLCEKEHCHCENGSIALSALNRFHGHFPLLPDGQEQRTQNLAVKGRGNIVMFEGKYILMGFLLVQKERTDHAARRSF